MGFFDKLKERMGKTRGSLAEKISSVVSGFKKVDEDFLEELEEVLILSDIGMATTEKIIDRIRQAAKEEKIKDTAEIKERLAEILE